MANTPALKDTWWRGAKNRVFQHLARIGPGSMTMRVLLHRARGVKIGEQVWIGYDVILDTSYPWLITIGDRVTISVRACVIAHFREVHGVEIGDDAFIGPGAIIMPGVKIGRGAVVAAGSVVTSCVPEMTVVQGNPAKSVARNTVVLGLDTMSKQFVQGLRPIR